MELRKSARFTESFMEIKLFCEDNKDLSLKDKFSLHLDKLRNQPAASPQELDKYVPIIFTLEVLYLWYFDVTVALPYFYGNDILLLRTLQILVCFLGIQIFVNLRCIYSVESEYNPQIHGTNPEICVESHWSKDDVNMGNNAPDSGNYGQRRQVTISPIPTYWAWSFCTHCNRPRPPRCHHCVICEKCVLKRDHHCFFARRCVGYHNLRHFTVFIFHATLAAIFSIVYTFRYLLLEVLPNSTYFDVIPFVTFIRRLFGYGHFSDGIFILAFWILVVMVIFAVVFFIQNWMWILSGKTSFELDNSIKLTNTSSLSGKLKAVFGDYWLLNFIVPLHTVFEPRDNPILWPNIQCK